MSALFPCIICNISFNDRRSLISHEKTQKHRKKAGESFRGFTCEPCGHQFSRIYDIKRHQQQGDCLGVQATVAQQMAVSSTRKRHADCSEIPNQRMRTVSPARRRNSDLGFDASNLDTVSAWKPERGEAGAILTTGRLGCLAHAISNSVSGDGEGSEEVQVFPVNEVAHQGNPACSVEQDAWSEVGTHCCAYHSRSSLTA